ncbi:hypothetical protein TKK_0014214 [Trichogramma kaykai]
MSFSDYGFDIFPYFGGRSRRQNRQRATGNGLADGDCRPIRKRRQKQKPQQQQQLVHADSCYQRIIEHLIELGTLAENQLVRVKGELAKYKQIELSEEQIEKLRNLEDTEWDECSSEYRRVIEYVRFDATGCAFIPDDRQDDSSSYVFETASVTWSIPGLDWSRDAPHATITEIEEKDRQIIELQNECNVKDAELGRSEEQNRYLESIMDKMKSEIQVLEDNSRNTQSEIERVVQQKSEELVATKQRIEQLEVELRQEQRAHSEDSQKVVNLRRALLDAQSLHDTLTNELKVAKQRLETLGKENSSLQATMKQLQRERDDLRKQNREQDGEIEKLLDIVQRLNDKYDRVKLELQEALEEASTSEERLSQCKAQLLTMESEVSRLVRDLSQVFGAGVAGVADSCCVNDVNDTEASSSGNSDIGDSAAAVHAHEEEEQQPDQAKLLSRGFERLMREHERCAKQRADLARQIQRLRSEDRAKRDSDIRSAAENFRSVKSDMKKIVDDLLLRIDAQRRLEETEQAYMGVVKEASAALEKLRASIDEHRDYRECENFLLLELERMQQALRRSDDALRSMIEETTSTELLPVIEERDSDDFIEQQRPFTVKNVTTQRILQCVDNSNQIVTRITAILTQNSIIKSMYKDDLEHQLNVALSELDDMNEQKSQLQDDLERSRGKCQQLVTDLDKCRYLLAEKNNELQSVVRQMQDRLQASLEKIDDMNNRLALAEESYVILKLEKNELIESLEKQLRQEQSKLKESLDCNDLLHSKLLEAGETIKQLERSVIQDTVRKVDLDALQLLQDQVADLVEEKNELVTRLRQLESHLYALQRDRTKVKNHLDRVSVENQDLERQIDVFKRENEKLLMGQKQKTKEHTQELIDNVDHLVKRFEQFNKAVVTKPATIDPAVQALQQQVREQKDKLRFQEKELLMKDKEVSDREQTIGQLKEELAKTEERNQANCSNLSDMIEQIQQLKREKSELKIEFKRTTAKYEEKLTEAYEQNQQKNQSIRNVDAWIQSLNKMERLELHDRICTTPLCPNSAFDMYEEQRKRSVRESIFNHQCQLKKTPGSVAAAAYPKRETCNKGNNNLGSRVATPKTHRSGASSRAPRATMSSHSIGSEKSQASTKLIAYQR